MNGKWVVVGILWIGGVGMAFGAGVNPLPLAVTVQGETEGDLAAVVDGVFLPDETTWNDFGTLWWGDEATTVTFDLGRVAEVAGLILQVDHNDHYRVTVSTDGRHWQTWREVRPGLGRARYGLETFGSQAEGPGFHPELAGPPVTTRYLRLQAVGGDGAYAVAEFQVFGRLTEPGRPDSARPAGRGVPVVAARGEYVGDPEVLTDGHFQPDGAAFASEETVTWLSESTVFRFDFGRTVEVRAVTVQVDHNDDYHVEASADGVSYRPLVSIRADAGRVEHGLETFSSDPAHAAYQVGLDFPPTSVRYLRLRGVGGDGLYGAAELAVQLADTGDR